MPARRTTATLAALATLAAAGAATVTAPTAQAATGTAPDPTPGYSLRHLHVTTHVGPTDGTTCVVDADLYKPDGSSPSSPASRRS